MIENYAAFNQLSTKRTGLECEMLHTYFITKHGSIFIMVLEMEAILRFQGAFSTQMTLAVFHSS